MKPDAEELKKLMKEAMDLIGKSVFENSHIPLRCWAGALAKMLALTYERGGLSHERFIEELAFIASEYKYLWEE